MGKRAEVIQGWIDARKERGETTKCMFYITVPKDWIVNIFLDNFFKVVFPVLYRCLIS